MQLTNPTWIHHSGGAIYSIDFHPNGTKLATCGQGSEGGSGLVVIWNVKPITNEKKAQDSCCPRMLSRMLHQACVNCVRWSPDGSLLACGGDDHAITVWEFGGRINSAGTIGSKDSINVEKYREKHRLHGHTMDILHLEWSKDGRFLASCGMDNTTIVWDAMNFPHKITILDKNRDGHDASVKGLSWDPIGKFLVTQAADKTLRIWRTDSWRCVKVIKEPFLESSPTAMFCRMDWSPDGAYLVVPSSMNNAGPTAQLIRRKDWDTSLDLVGHRKATTVVKACPRLISYCNHKGLRLQVSCIAVGSRDKTLSVWLIPRVDRPLIVLHKLFKHSILDFSWHDFHLIICSMDGSVKSVVFSESEVGHLLTSMEMGEVCERLYSTMPSQYNMQGVLRSDTLVNKTNGNVFVDDYEKIVEKSNAEKSKVLSEAKKKEELMQRATVGVKSAVENPDSFKQAVAVPETLNQKAENKKPPEVTHSSEQKEVRTKSGKRRIQPVFVASLVSTEPENAGTEDIAESNGLQAEKMVPEVKRIGQIIVDTELPAGRRERTPIRESIPVIEEEPPRKQSRQLPILSEKPELRRLPALNPVSAVVKESRIVNFAIPDQKRELVVKLEGEANEIDVIQAINEFELSGIKISVLRGTTGQSEKWRVFLDPIVAILAANNRWTAAACYDRSITVLSTSSGRLIFKPFVDSVTSSVVLSEDFLSVCTFNGYLYVWNLEERNCILFRQNLADIFEEGDQLLSHVLAPGGIPVLTLCSNKTFAYSFKIGCWQKMNVDLLNSSKCMSLRKSPSLGKETLLSEIAASNAMSLVPVNTTEKSLLLQAFLEERLCAARALDLSDVFMLYLPCYVQALVETANVGKVRELVSSLYREEKICGKLDRGSVLSEIYAGVRNVSAFADIARDLSFIISPFS